MPCATLRFDQLDEHESDPPTQPTASTLTTTGNAVAEDLHHSTNGNLASVIINSKGGDFLFADHRRSEYAQSGMSSLIVIMPLFM